MQQYLDFLWYIRTQGTPKADRTHTGTLSVFGQQMRFDLSQGFPLVTTKKLHIKSILYELLWFLRGETNIGYLNDNGVTIWDEWADEQGNLGPIYGKQWRAWPTSDNRTIDQLQQVVEALKYEPASRRLIVSAWNVGELDKMRLPPCHILFQFYVVNGKLSCGLFMRSMDAFLGTPFNIASYAFLTHMMAQQCNLNVGELVIFGGDCHIYLNHLVQVDLQLSRTPYPLPQLQLLRKPKSLFDYAYEDFVMINYQAHPPIKATVAV